MAVLTPILTLAAVATALPAANLTTYSFFAATNNVTTREVNPLFTSGSNPSLDTYPTQLQLIVTALKEELRHIKVNIPDTGYSCDFDLNCADHNPDTAGPRQDIGWSTYYVPCLGNEPIEIHHGEFCRQKGRMGFQFDNLWFRYADQFFNVPNDCPRDQKEVHTSPPDPCRGPPPDLWLPWPPYLWPITSIPDPSFPYRHTCKLGSYKTVEEIAETMEHPGEPRGTPFGRPYCQGDGEPAGDGKVPHGQ